jgi:hypothetical protein
MKNDHTYAALIINNDPRKDHYFKAFLRNSAIFTVLHNCNMDQIQKEEIIAINYDFLFYADNISENFLVEIKTSINKTDPKNKRTRIILYSTKENIPRKKLIRCLLAGANSVLISPFSVEGLFNACGLSDQNNIDNSSKTRLAVAVKMMIQDSVEESETPSMVQKITEETKQQFKELTDRNLSNNVMSYFSNLKHYSRIGNYDLINKKISELVKETLSPHYSSDFVTRVVSV